MKIAVIGAGWAGAAAAWQLYKNGHQTVVFEAAHIVGGRARKHTSSVLGQVVDNGQHILLGAYSSTLNLMREIGINTDHCFYRSDLDILRADQRFRFKAAPLPAPLHLLSALFTAKGIPFKQRFKLITLQSYLVKNRWRVPSNMTVLQLLQHTKQPRLLIQNLWHPLCIAALNTPIETASAQLFSYVLRDSLGGSRQDAQILIPLVNMSDLWPQSALKYVDLRLGVVVRELIKKENGYEIDGELFDAIIIATNAPSTARLLKPLIKTNTLEKSKLIKSLEQFTFNPIATVYLQPEKPWDNPHAMLMLEENPQSLAVGQWVFNHAAIPNSELKNVISVTISYANRLKEHSKTQIIDAIIGQIQTQTQHSLPHITHSELITEKRATFVAHTHLSRPTTHTPWEKIKLAGDWVDSEYPAVLEGAVRSGLAAAHAVGTS